MEMPGRGKPGKPNPGFPAFPPALGNRNCDSHIPTAPALVFFPFQTEPEKPHKGARRCVRPVFSPSGSFTD
jgi:hypothetical protein